MSAKYDFELTVVCVCMFYRTLISNKPCLEFSGYRVGNVDVWRQQCKDSS